MSVAVPDADELRVTATIWQRLKEFLPQAEHAEVYQRIGPALIDDNEVLLAEQSSLLDILSSYRREADGVARKRAEAGRLVRQPAQEMLRQRLQQLFLETAGVPETISEEEDGVVQYCLALDGVPPRPLSRGASAVSSRQGVRASTSTYSSGGVISSVASVDTAPTQLSPSACRREGGVDFSGMLSEISVRSAEAQHRFSNILPRLKDLLSEERSLLEEDIRWLHELLVDEMQYMARARSFTEPSATLLAKLCNRLERSPPGTPCLPQACSSPPRKAAFAVCSPVSPAPPAEPNPRLGRSSPSPRRKDGNRLTRARRFAAEADEVDTNTEHARMLLDAAASGSISAAEVPGRGRPVAEHFDIGLELSDSE